LSSRTPRRPYPTKKAADVQTVRICIPDCLSVSFFKNVFLLTNQLIYEHKPLKIFAACTARSADDAPNKMSTKEEEEDMRKSF